MCAQDPHSLLGNNRLGLYLGPDIDFGIKRVKPASSQLSAKNVARLYAELAGHQLHDSSAPEASLLLNLLCSEPFQSAPPSPLPSPIKGQTMALQIDSSVLVPSRLLDLLCGKASEPLCSDLHCLFCLLDDCAKGLCCRKCMTTNAGWPSAAEAWQDLDICIEVTGLKPHVPGSLDYIESFPSPKQEAYFAFLSEHIMHLHTLPFIHHAW